MGKYRSKLKRKVKGKSWAHGQSSTAVPESNKYRSKALSKYFKANLNDEHANTNNNQQTGITLEQILHHDAQLSYAKETSDPTVNDVANSLKSFKFDNDNITESQGFTSKTFQTFASNYSQCSNISFSKLLNTFRGDSHHHKEMLAVLSACTEIITERGGKQTSTEYLIILNELLDDLDKTDEEIISILSLLGLCIKTVPQPVLRKVFSDLSKTLIELIERFINTENQNILKNIIGILAVLLRAQEYSLWSLSSTTQVFNTILSFVTHTKPNIRKAAQQAITSIILGSCFMPQSLSLANTDIEEKTEKNIIHPATRDITTFSVKHFSSENISKNQTVVLHVLVLLKSIMGSFKSEEFKIICEHLLAMMTASNVLIRTNCLHTFHFLFSSKSYNMNSLLIGKLISALYDYLPDKNDVRQSLAWLTVMKQGHIFLSKQDASLCMNIYPKFFELFTNQIWMYDRVEIINATTNALTETLEECVKPISTQILLINTHKHNIKKIITLISNCLLTPFGQSKKDVVLVLSKMYLVTGKHFAEDLMESITILGGRYDDEKQLRANLEHAIISAISSTGPDTVLNAIPISQNNNFILERSWLLPLLREGIINSSFEYFTNKIIPLASACNKKWDKFKKENNVPLAHTYELLCCQLWGLFPGFCRSPSDPDNFKLIAKTLGTILNEHPDLRAPVFDGLNELILNCNEPMKVELQKYSKNFLPRLFNVYTTKPNGTYENDLRETCFKVIKNYLTITPESILEDLFEHGVEQLKSSRPGTFLGDSLYDIVEALALCQNRVKLNFFYEKYITCILKHKQNPKVLAGNEIRIRKQQKKCYGILIEIMNSKNTGCTDFIRKSCNNIDKLLTDTHGTTSVGARTSRIRCIHTYLQLSKSPNIEKQLIKNTISEAILVLHEFPKSDNVSQKTLELIGRLYEEQNKLNDFIDIVIAGFIGDTNLISNTILALKVIVHNLNKSFTITSLEFILDQVLSFLVNKNRKPTEASISFLITYTKVLPTPLIANHMEKIVKSLSAMAPDTKRYCRIQYGYIFKRLCKRFGAKEIIKLVPGSDELTHKRLKQIRKALARESRKSNAIKSNDSDDNEEEILELKSQTIDDILKDSDDSDSDDLIDEDIKQHKNGPAAKKRKRETMFIQEAPESITDLADINTIRNISTSLPKPNTKQEVEKKDKNRGFKTADDGRLIIADSSGEDSEDDNDINPNIVDKTEMKKKSNKGIADDMDTDDDDCQEESDLKRLSKKRKFDTKSVSSRKTSDSKYIAGGSGIHRNTSSSVKSGYSGKNIEFGSQYKSKKASGDSKKKGLLDPYAYIPLSRKVLNKRKVAKNIGQFKNIVRGARKGAAAGSRNKIRKTRMMK